MHNTTKKTPERFNCEDSKRDEKTLVKDKRKTPTHGGRATGFHSRGVFDAIPNKPRKQLKTNA